ncbi:peptidyl-prolyl cis-trans isomerase [Pseudoalteromonas tunicata]|jgi:hypothetical protein|uniref:peptidylprolyl isomerase n=1 Tax=Pseudoalteromonas tunicata D2 TaxID=87626 RepID=A4C510_9GAMM|nr:peptidylprolyl isomerase [Pseudoalteromonas tunicata]ATC96885.1 hypothetical protein PTUN_b0508 [Pseudoalteromonas tunicata]AXT33019.1 peptidyl-prolyl cis-trans isomerase [Pseudoalteromonas tunicata]EAR30642.1 PpiC-type peptidyl-prolyl cis-trans isomerase [Pseudoalteromonas tunicata D2]
MRYLIFIALGLLSGCDLSDKPSQINSSTELKEQLVKVNNEIITTSELDVVMEQTFGSYASLQLGELGQKKVLESIIIKKLMAQSQLALMSTDEIYELELAMRIHRDELLSKRYIQKNISPEPVSDEMALSYYEKNLADFGQKTTRKYHLVRLNISKGQSPDAAQTVLEQFSDTADWQSLSINTVFDGQTVQFFTGHQAEKGLDPFYQNIIAKLAVNEASDSFSLKGSLIKLKVVSEQVNNALPFSQVRTKIKKSLAPLQLKKAIQEDAALLKKQAKITHYAMD